MLPLFSFLTSAALVAALIPDPHPNHGPEDQDTCSCLSPAASSFVNSDVVVNAANKAVTPDGYTNTGSNGNKWAPGDGSLGFADIDEFDSGICAVLCDTITECSSFQIYYEKSQAGDAQAKCAFWGGVVTSDNAKVQVSNEIGACNTYTSNKVVPPNGFDTPKWFGSQVFNHFKGSDAAKDFISSKFFSDNSFDTSRCAEEMSARGGSFYNTYLVSKDGVPQGQYCDIYSNDVSDTQPSFGGKIDASDNTTISNSFFCGRYKADEPPKGKWYEWRSSSTIGSQSSTKSIVDWTDAGSSSTSRSDPSSTKQTTSLSSGETSTSVSPLSVRPGFSTRSASSGKTTTSTTLSHGRPGLSTGSRPTTSPGDTITPWTYSLSHPHDSSSTRSSGSQDTISSSVSRPEYSTSSQPSASPRETITFSQSHLFPHPQDPSSTSSSGTTSSVTSSSGRPDVPFSSQSTTSSGEITISSGYPDFPASATAITSAGETTRAATSSFGHPDPFSHSQPAGNASTSAQSFSFSQPQGGSSTFGPDFGSSTFSGGFSTPSFSVPSFSTPSFSMPQFHPTSSTSSGRPYGTTTSGSSTTISSFAVSTWSQPASSQTTAGTTSSSSGSDHPQGSSAIIELRPNGQSGKTAVISSAYMAVSGNSVQVVLEKSKASKFDFVDGYLMYGDKYVGVINSDYEFTSFNLFTADDLNRAICKTWSSNRGSLTFSSDKFSFDGGFAGFCSSDTSLYVATKSHPSADICTPCSPVAVPDNHQSSTKSAVVSSTTSSSDAGSSSTTSVSTTDSTVATTSVTSGSTTASTTASTTPSTTASTIPNTTLSTTASTTPSSTPSTTPRAIPSTTPSTTPSTSLSTTLSTTASLSVSTSISTSASTTPSTTPSTNPSTTPSTTPSTMPSSSAINTTGSLISTSQSSSTSTTSGSSICSSSLGSSSTTKSLSAPTTSMLSSSTTTPASQPACTISSLGGVCQDGKYFEVENIYYQQRCGAWLDVSVIESIQRNSEIFCVSLCSEDRTCYGYEWYDDHQMCTLFEADFTAGIAFVSNLAVKLAGNPCQPSTGSTSTTSSATSSSTSSLDTEASSTTSASSSSMTSLTTTSQSSSSSETSSSQTTTSETTTIQTSSSQSSSVTTSTTSESSSFSTTKSTSASTSQITSETTSLTSSDTTTTTVFSSTTHEASRTTPEMSTTSDFVLYSTTTSIEPSVAIPPTNGTGFPGGNSTVLSFNATRPGFNSSHPASDTTHMNSTEWQDWNTNTTTNLTEAGKVAGIIASANLTGFCSQLLTYTTPVITSYVPFTTTIDVTETITDGTLTSGTTDTGTLITVTATITSAERDWKIKRSAAGGLLVQTPTPLASFADAAVSQACSWQATPVTVASTQEVTTTDTATSTIYVTVPEEIVPATIETLTATSTFIVNTCEPTAPSQLLKNPSFECYKSDWNIGYGSELMWGPNGTAKPEGLTQEAQEYVDQAKAADPDAIGPPSTGGDPSAGQKQGGPPPSNSGAQPVHRRQEDSSATGPPADTHLDHDEGQYEHGTGPNWTPKEPAYDGDTYIRLSPEPDSNFGVITQVINDLPAGKYWLAYKYRVPDYALNNDQCSVNVFIGDTLLEGPGIPTDLVWPTDGWQQAGGFFEISEDMAEANGGSAMLIVDFYCPLLDYSKRQAPEGVGSEDGGDQAQAWVEPEATRPLLDIDYIRMGVDEGGWAKYRSQKPDVGDAAAANVAANVNNDLSVISAQQGSQQGGQS